MIFVRVQFRLQISYLPPVFTLDLFENGDVRNVCKEQNTGTELDGININSTPGHFYISLLSVRKECKNVLLLKLSLINWNTVNVNSNFSCENCLLFQIIALSLQSRVPSVLKLLVMRSWSQTALELLKFLMIAFPISRNTKAI